MKTNKHVIITGEVQGVWFRASTKQKAEQLGIKGWVKNTSDGKVEAFFQGTENKVKKILEWCKNGPSLAEVLDVQVEDASYDNVYDDFKIR